MSGTASIACTPSLAAQAAQDWLKALRMWRLWTALGMEDLSDRYRRTIFGISWVVGSFAIFVLVKVMVFGQMTSASFSEFAMFVALGFGLWSFISTTVLDCCTAYSSSSGWLLGTSIPYPVFFFQGIFRNWLVFALTLMVMLGFLIWKKDHWSLQMLWALPGFLAYAVAPIWLAAILAPLCLRFRDVNHAMQTVMRLLFFVTPILWLPGTTPQLEAIAHYNVITHFIEIIRQPLVYDRVPIGSWLVVVVVNVVGAVTGALTYAITRNRIAYWL